MRKTTKQSHISMREIQHNLKKYVTLVTEGNEIIVTKAGRCVAKLVPFEESAPQKFKLPNFEARLKKNFPRGQMVGPPVAKIISDSRE